MPLTFPIPLPPQVRFLEQGVWEWDFIISWANSYRSLDVATVVVSDDVLPPGTLLHNAGDGTFVEAEGAGDVDAILCQWIDGVPDRVTIVTRDAEVRDSGIAYGDLNVADVNTRLRTLGIIVRESVLASSQNATFAENLWSQPSAGGPAVGVAGELGAPAPAHVGIQTFHGSEVQHDTKPQQGVNVVTGEHLEQAKEQQQPSGQPSAPTTHT